MCRKIKENTLKYTKINLQLIKVVYVNDETNIKRKILIQDPQPLLQGIFFLTSLFNFKICFYVQVPLELVA